MVSFSVLLCTYAKDNPLHLKQSLKSITTQTVLPNQLIIVKDGLLPKSLENVIKSISFPNDLTIIALPKNVTLGPARAAGVRAAKHEWVALADSDDICLPNRFKIQLSLIAAKNIDIIGGQIIEFDDIPGNALSVRNVPTTHKKILTRVKTRNPFNAMTVMFKRDLALKAGNFQKRPGFEDYALWARMIAKGAKCANCPDTLVHARIGNGLYDRRRGVGYIRSEWRMQKQLRATGITNTFEYIRNICTRIPIRLLPSRLLQIIYEKFARKE